MHHFPLVAVELAIDEARGDEEHEEVDDTVRTDPHGDAPGLNGHFVDWPEVVLDDVGYHCEQDAREAEGDSPARDIFEPGTGVILEQDPHGQEHSSFAGKQHGDGGDATPEDRSARV